MAMIYVQRGYVIDTAIPVTVEEGAINCPNAIIHGTKGKPIDLEWRMETPGYEIDDVVIDQTEFTNKQKIKSGHYKCLNNMSKQKAYKYKITVIDSKGKKIELDPMIRNEP